MLKQLKWDWKDRSWWTEWEGRVWESRMPPNAGRSRLIQEMKGPCWHSKPSFFLSATRWAHGSHVLYPSFNPGIPVSLGGQDTKYRMFWK